MIKYTLYWIEKDVAQYFYHKGELLYRFFLEYLQSNNQHTIVQYEYITNYIPHTDLKTYIAKKGRIRDMQVAQIDERLQLTCKNLQVDLIFKNKAIEIHAESLLAAETVIFPILRNFKSSFFIIGEDSKEYGWISPFLSKDRKKKDERLYSFL